MKKTGLTFFVILYSTLQLKAQTAELWGMTPDGGACSAGTIFKTDGNGNNHSVQKHFEKTDGKEPFYLTLCEADNGKLYGTTAFGGAFGAGVIFEYDPVTGTYTKKIDFDNNNLGSTPYGSLIKTGNGKLLGMTTYGAKNSRGSIYEYDPSTNTCVKKVDFMDTGSSHPEGTFMKASNGKMYGLTKGDWVFERGMLFEYDPVTAVCTKKFKFDAASGNVPVGSLMQTADGKLYGMTSLGGAFNKGVLFEFDLLTGIYKKKIDFNDSLGKLPKGSLMQASNGKLYGMTERGGASDAGVLFEFDPQTDAYLKKIDFDGKSQGGSPKGNLMQASNGKLYGMNCIGGNFRGGVLFEFDIATSAYAVRMNFNYQGATGACPQGTLMQASNGKLYGTTRLGGAGISNKGGVLFEYDPVSAFYIKKIDFNRSLSGCTPKGALTYASNGKFYGLTHNGGIHDLGVLFEYDAATLTFTKKIDLTDTLNGTHPSGTLLQADNGKLYGLTSEGGTHNAGVLFEYDPLTETYSKKIDFERKTLGMGLYGSLIQVNKDKLYGVSQLGGTADQGTLFEYNLATAVITKKIDFDSILTKGFQPCGTLLKASNGKLYGMTTWGGSTNKGIIFEYDPEGDVYQVAVNFNDSINGIFPQGSLIQATNGKLYGMTARGGLTNAGVLFEYDYQTGTYAKKIDFNGLASGSNPKGALLQASNGKLYGMTETGGVSGVGVLFEYDPATNIFFKKSDFNIKNGKGPLYGPLIEVPGSIGVTENDLFKNVHIFPNPAKGAVQIDLNGLKNVSVKLMNINGQVIQQQEKVNDRVHQLEINGPAGNYILELVSQGKPRYYKVIKK